MPSLFEACFRHALHYESVLRAINELYLRGGEIGRALELFEDEWGSVGAAHSWVEKNAGGSEAASELCSRYADAGRYVISLWLHPRERILWLEAAVAASSRSGRRRAERVHTGNLASSYAELGEIEHALKLYQETVSAAIESGDVSGGGNVVGNLSSAYLRLGEYRRALELYEERLTFTRARGDRRGEAHALGNIGIVYRCLGEPEWAIEYHERDLEIAHELGDRLAKAWRWAILAYASEPWATRSALSNAT